MLGRVESEPEAYSNHIIILPDAESVQPQSLIISTGEPKAYSDHFVILPDAEPVQPDGLVISTEDLESRQSERVESISLLMNGSNIEADPSFMDKVLGTVLGPFGFDVEYWQVKKKSKRRDE